MYRSSSGLICTALVLLGLVTAGCKDQSDATDDFSESPGFVAAQTFAANTPAAKTPVAKTQAAATQAATTQAAATPAGGVAISPAALKARVNEVIAYTRDQRLMNTRDQSAWQIVHGLIAFGRDLKIEADGHVVGALDYILQGNPLRGWTLRPGDKGLIAILEAGSKTGQGHPDQWLGCMSQFGVKIDEPVIVGGKTYHVRDLMTEAQWDIYDGMEASWTLMAATTYLPLNATWKAKDGQTWSIERIVKMEAAQPLGSGGCAGTHRLYALTRAVNRYMKETGKTPQQLTGPWLAAHNRMEQGLEAVKNYELPDGTLSTSFFTHAAYSPDIGARLYSAGHLLEFLDVALLRKELGDEWVERAVNRLCDLLDQTRSLNVECGTLYHAAHGLVLYRKLRWGPPSKSSPTL